MLKYTYNNTTPIRDAAIIDMVDGELQWLKMGGVNLGLPPWKLKRMRRRAAERIDNAYQQALYIGSMHSANYNRGE